MPMLVSALEMFRSPELVIVPKLERLAPELLIVPPFVSWPELMRLPSLLIVPALVRLAPAALSRMLEFVRVLLESI